MRGMRRKWSLIWLMRGDRRRIAGLDHALDDAADGGRAAQQVRTAMRFLRDLLYRAAKVDVHDADLQLVRKFCPTAASVSGSLSQI
jgi:hypothetical protein